MGKRQTIPQTHTHQKSAIPHFLQKTLAEIARVTVANTQATATHSPLLPGTSLT
jgi:hypothetical protein